MNSWRLIRIEKEKAWEEFEEKYRNEISHFEGWDYNDFVTYANVLMDAAIKEARKDKDKEITKALIYEVKRQDKSPGVQTKIIARIARIATKLNISLKEMHNQLEKQTEMNETEHPRNNPKIRNR